MTWIKICGITNLEDALTAVDAGADALGFIFYAKSPRKVDPEPARKIVARLPSKVEKIGVFVLQDSKVLQDPEPALQIAEQVGLTSLQIHMRSPLGGEGDHNTGLAAICPALKRKFYPAMPAAWFLGDDPVSASLSSFLEKRPERPFDSILLDSGTAEQPGGTGKRFDWAKAAPRLEQMSGEINVIVAGGLDPANVPDAIHLLKPWGVDVSSGVEASPGKKDSKKVRAFVRAVRESDRNK